MSNLLERHIKFNTHSLRLYIQTDQFGQKISKIYFEASSLIQLLTSDVGCPNQSALEMVANDYVELKTLDPDNEPIRVFEKSKLNKYLNSLLAQIEKRRPEMGVRLKGLISRIFKDTNYLDFLRQKEPDTDTAEPEPDDGVEEPDDSINDNRATDDTTNLNETVQTEAVSLSKWQTALERQLKNEIAELERVLEQKRQKLKKLEPNRLIETVLRFKGMSFHHPKLNTEVTVTDVVVHRNTISIEFDTDQVIDILELE